MRSHLSRSSLHQPFLTGSTSPRSKQPPNRFMQGFGNSSLSVADDWVRWIGASGRAPSPDGVGLEGPCSEPRLDTALADPVPSRRSVVAPRHSREPTERRDAIHVEGLTLPAQSLVLSLQPFEPPLRASSPRPLAACPPSFVFRAPLARCTHRRCSSGACQRTGEGLHVGRLSGPCV